MEPLRRLMLYPTELRARSRGCVFVGNDEERLRLACWRNAPSAGWSGREDLNLRHPAPKAGALPGCATPRRVESLVKSPSAFVSFRSINCHGAPSHLFANPSAFTMLLKPVTHLCKSLRTMTHTILFFNRQLSQRLIEFRHEKHWIIPETSISNRLFRDQSF